MPPISDKKIYDLLNLIYETTFETSSDRWTSVYKSMCKSFSSGPGSLSFYLSDENKFELIASTLDKECFQEYNDHYYKVSPFRRKIEKMKAGEIFRRSEHCSDKAFLKTELYQEYFKKQDVFHYDYEVLFKESNVSGGISFSRSESIGDFNDHERDVMRLIIPHIRRAFQVFYEINQSRKDNQIIAEVLNRIPQSVIVTNKSGKTIYLNDNAQKIIDDKDGLQIDEKGNLVANLSRETKKINKILHSVFYPNIEKNNVHGGTIQISRPSGLRPFSMLVSPITDQPVFSSESESVALIFVTDPEQKTETVEQVLCDIYGLTPAECKLASILAQGKSLKEACDILNVKDNTVRTHLKHIFSKTDTHRQSDLIRLILTSPANLRRIKIKKRKG